MLNILQCFKKTHKWRKARPAQGKREETVGYMKADVTDRRVLQLHASLLLAFRHLLSIFTTTWLTRPWVRGKSHPPHGSDEPLYALHLPLLMSCTPPLYSILACGSRTYHSKESSGWKQGHPLYQALKPDSTQPTRARFQWWVWDSLIVKSFSLFQSIFSLFNATYKLKHKNNPLLCICLIHPKNYST